MPHRAHTDPGQPRAASAALNLLLVARTAHWSAAVMEAAAEFGVHGISACGARDALARLSSTGQRYSHLLVEPDCADGLMDALVDITSDPAGGATSVLMLGGALVSKPGIGVIHCATTQAVFAALTLPASANVANEGRMLPSDLKAALASAMIETRYQPIVLMADRQPVALEALARLNHPVLGTLAPDRFVPQMEDAGLAAQLTERVSHSAFADMTGPHLAGLDLRMTVNFPLDVLLAQEALNRLEEQRSAAGVEPDRIVIELTESRPVDDLVTLKRALEWLRARGYRIAIDDVGPAVPGLASLLELPFTILKLDKDLVQQVETNAEGAAFLQTTIDQAQSHGLLVVAEGVETIGIWNRMKAMGAGSAQGFLVARPLPVAAVPIWMDSWKATPEFA